MSFQSRNWRFCRLNVTHFLIFAWKLIFLWSKNNFSFVSFNRPDAGKFISRTRYDTVSGLYSTTTFATMRTNQTNFICFLNINGTDYQRSTNNTANGKSDEQPSRPLMNEFQLMLIFFSLHSWKLCRCRFNIRFAVISQPNAIRPVTFIICDICDCIQHILHILKYIRCPKRKPLMCRSSPTQITITHIQRTVYLIITLPKRTMRQRNKWKRKL